MPLQSPLPISRRSGNGQRSQGAHSSGAAGAGLSDGFPAGCCRPNTPPTRPALHRNDPERDGVYTVDEPQYQTLPFPPPPFRVSAHYDVPALGSRTHGPAAKTPEALPEISAPVLVAFADEKGAEQKRRAGHRAGVFGRTGAGRADHSDREWFRAQREGGREFQPDRQLPGQLCAWRSPRAGGSSPRKFPCELRQRGDKKHFEFKVVPGSLKEGHAQIRAVLDCRRQELQRRLHPGDSRRPGQRLLLSAGAAARQHRGCESPEGSEGGYIMGAGDEIPTVLQQIGIDVDRDSGGKTCQRRPEPVTEPSFSASAPTTRRRMSRPTTRSCWITFRRAAR